MVVAVNGLMQHMQTCFYDVEQDELVMDGCDVELLGAVQSTPPLELVQVVMKLQVE